MSNELQFSSGVQIIGYFFEKWSFSSTLHLNDLIIGHDDDLTKLLFSDFHFTHARTHTTKPSIVRCNFNSKWIFFEDCTILFSNFQINKRYLYRDLCEHGHFVRVYFHSLLLN